MLSNDLAAANNYARFAMLAELSLHVQVMEEGLDVDPFSDLDDTVRALAAVAREDNRELTPFARELTLIEQRLARHFDAATVLAVVRRLAVMVNGQG